MRNLAQEFFAEPDVAGAARSPADRWALAVGAMYGRVHGYSHDRLLPQNLLRGVSEGRSRAMLREAWGVLTHDQAIDALDWLAQRGHRSDPEFAAPGDMEALRDLLAWDMARCVMVARHAFHALYLTLAEGWKYVREAARLAQANYASWEEYGHRYLRGRLRWNGEPEKRIDAAVDFLLTNPKSPWRQLDWRTPLVWPEGETRPAAH